MNNSAPQGHQTHVSAERPARWGTELQLRAGQGAPGGEGGKAVCVKPLDQCRGTDRREPWAKGRGAAGEGALFLEKPCWPWPRTQKRKMDCVPFCRRWATAGPSDLRAEGGERAWCQRSHRLIRALSPEAGSKRCPGDSPPRGGGGKRPITKDAAPSRQAGHTRKAPRGLFPRARGVACYSGGKGSWGDPFLAHLLLFARAARAPHLKNALFWPPLQLELSL